MVPNSPMLMGHNSTKKYATLPPTISYHPFNLTYGVGDVSCTTLMLQLHRSTVYARLPRHGCKSVLPCSYRTSAIGGPPYMVPCTKHPSISSRSYQMSAVGGLALTAYVTPQWVSLLSTLPNTSPGHFWATFQSPETSTTSSL